MLFDFLYGVNTIISLLDINSGRRKIYEIIINSSKLKTSRINEIIKKAGVKKIPIRYLNPGDFLNYLKTKTTIYATGEELQGSQGIIARVSQYSYYDLDYSLKNELKGKKNSLLVILDGITDVGNFGSILRNCSAFAVDGIIISKNRCVQVNERVSKISSGALEELKIYRVVNTVKAIERLKEEGFWIYGTTAAKEPGVLSAGDINFTFPMAVVLGSEEKGIGHLIYKKCDFLITIETAGAMQSLNVSIASGIILYIIRNSVSLKS
ncbi:MAG: 23S rRNA (guanosine(2251)-2'-O)-methyltransferase RlmB [Actinobacteria bacterium]|nr:23S rRNA (guanosine(2251)-2'-O)-methyltransferase RlmB [Actinomycetota bacterium]MBM3712421.1 23S rRNA (guanosine(2251)-2'-O)-methyltransferase RlmB [Actinomycetota bacterium]